MKKLIVVVAAAGVLGGFSIPQYLNLPQSVTITTEETVPAVQTQKEPPVELPTRLMIGKIGVNAKVQPVGEDEQGKMAVPDKWEDTGWYRYGVKPGESGKAVIAGHFDQPEGASTFYRLEDLETGDTVEVLDEAGGVYRFAVVDKQVYPDREFPVDRVFGKSDRILLNLITCEGIYDRASRNYQQRLVVFTELVD